jgi:DNA-binding XRE family transcriptional regulator
MTSTDGPNEQRQMVAARLRETREYLGLSQEEVAAVLGLSRPAITNMESGSRKVEAVELDQLAKLYGTTVAFLLHGDKKSASSDAESKVAFYARTLQGLSQKDLEEVARFADFLRSSGKNPRGKK